MREKNSAPFFSPRRLNITAGHAALAVVLVGLRPRVVIAVGHRTLADVEAQELGAALDGEIEGGILESGLAGQMSEIVSGTPGAFIMP